MTGRGEAGGAGTIVNAIATGKGAAFGLALRVRAEIQESRSWSVESNGTILDASEAKLSIESAKQVLTRARATPHAIAITTDIPPQRGLKSSSAVAVAVVRAALDLSGRRWGDAKILRAAAQAGLRSGTSITGAYDDASACLLGGVVVTDNRRFRIVHRGELPRGLSALVNVPQDKVATASLKNVDFGSVRSLVEGAWADARSGRYDRAMIVNSAAYAGVLGRDTRFTFEALQEGAWAAGLSGKGPAEIALAQKSVLTRLQAKHPDSMMVSLRRAST